MLKKLSRVNVRINTIEWLLWFIHYPKTKFQSKDETWWCLKSDLSVWAGKGKIKINKIPYTLLNTSSVTNPDTKRNIGIYYISKSNFNKIKDFWIKNYCITDIYKITKEIQQITQDQSLNIGIFFDKLLNDYYLHFAIYNDKETLDKTDHLIYWLNFIVQIFDKLEIPKNSNYYKSYFKYTYLLKELNNEYSDWRWLRNKLIHFFDKKTVNYKWWVECDEKKFTVTIEENNEQDSLIFLWENFHKFLIQALNKIKKELIKGASVQKNS